jgi:hypothetical protein
MSTTVCLHNCMCALIMCVLLCECITMFVHECVCALMCVCTTVLCITMRVHDCMNAFLWTTVCVDDCVYVGDTSCVNMHPCVSKNVCLSTSTKSSVIFARLTVLVTWLHCHFPQSPHHYHLRTRHLFVSQNLVHLREVQHTHTQRWWQHLCDNMPHK